jgi:MFS family permease
MAFWSLAYASHRLAALIVSRLLHGIGEGGGFPAATRKVAERFARERCATAPGIINAGISVGGVITPSLIALLLATRGVREVPRQPRQCVNLMRSRPRSIAARDEHDAA